MNLFQWEELCMGTYFRFQINSDRPSSEIARFLNEACEFLHEADARFSLYKDDSELSKIARKELLIENASNQVRKIEAECRIWGKHTDGWFDAINPDGIFDPSGIVKTWAAKQACLYLEANGFTDFTLNAGGDIYLSTELTVKPLFKVGLANLNTRASDKAGTSMVVNLSKTDYRAAATSGSIEKGDHIWSKKIEKGPGTVLQVTVIGTELVETDVWATAIYSGGLAALERFSKVNEDSASPYIAVITFADGAMLATKSFAHILESR